MILQRKSIVDYLEKKNIRPTRQMGDKFVYLCPFPDHQDKKPSFIVWVNNDHETFHCFGCQRGSTIINLVSIFESISYRDAFNRLAKDLDVSLEENVQFSLESMNKLLTDAGSSPYDTYFDLSQKMISISSLCRFYLESVNYDVDECSIMESFWREIDQYILNYDFIEIDQVLKNIPDILRLRREKFERLKLEKQKLAYQ